MELGLCYLIFQEKLCVSYMYFIVRLVLRKHFSLIRLS